MEDTEVAQVAPYRSDQEPGQDGFAQVLRAEWTKFRTVRGWMITLVVAAVVAVALALLGASGSHSGSCTGPTPAHMTCTAGHPPVATGPGGAAVADSYTFVHRTLAGNGTLTARVTSLSGRHMVSNAVRAASPTTGPSATGPSVTPAELHPGMAPWAKAGLILEEASPRHIGTHACSTLKGGTSTCPAGGGPYAAVMATGAHGVHMQYDFTHDIAGTPGAVTSSSPRWLRLQRTGDLVTGYESLDGTHWTTIGTATLAGLPKTVEVGLFVTSPQYFPPGNNNGFPSLATAGFDHVAMRGDFRGGNWHGAFVGTNTLYPTMPGDSWHQRPTGTFTLSGSGDIAPLVGAGIGNEAGASMLVGGLAGLIVLLVLATLFITSEYRRGLIRTTFAAAPRRGRVLAAKAIVIGSVAFVAGMAGAAVGEVVSRHILVANGNFLFPLSGLTEARIVVGTGLVLGLAAVLALGIATTLRRSAGAVVAGIVVFVLPFVLGTTLSTGASNWLMRLTPMAAFAVQGAEPRSALVTSAYTMINGYYPLAPWAGLLVLCAYAGAALLLAAWLLRRRDV